jgi:phospholipid/cholesterol/gamma-HCH transport system substrate-binding protein
MRNGRALVNVAVLVVVSALCAVTMIITYGSIRFDGQVPYGAVFEDVTGLRPGDDVRIAGVTVGRVEDVVVDEQNLVQVDFTVQERSPLLVGSQATIRYKNLIGQRYLEITEGVGAPQRLESEDVIPVAQTRPALDLDELYNGFAPLFEGLAPEQVNELSSSLIAVFQGQGGAIEGLLGSIGSLTSTLADKDQVIGAIVTNLNTFLATANERGPQVAGLVDELQQLVSGLAADREPLGGSLERIEALTGTVAGLLEEARPALAADIAETERLSRVINADSEELNTLLQRLPGYYQILGRLGIYQQGFQFYLCGAQVRVGDVLSDVIASQEARCQY